MPRPEVGIRAAAMPRPEVGIRVGASGGLHLNESINLKNWARGGVIDLVLT
mgnify:CR=1 FL=1